MGIYREAGLIPGLLTDLISSPDFVKSSLKEKSNPNKQYKNPKESAIEGKADNTNGKDNFKVKDYKNDKNNKELVVKVTARLI